MPYDVDSGSDMTSMKDKLKRTYKNISDKAARQAIHVFNSIMDSSKDEGRAWAGVYAALNNRGLGKKKKGSDLRSGIIRLAATYPKGSPERGKLLSVLGTEK